jgi:hypothetical protein
MSQCRGTSGEECHLKRRMLGGVPSQEIDTMRRRGRPRKDKERGGEYHLPS